MYLGFKENDSEVMFGGVNSEKVLPGAKFHYYAVPLQQGNYWEVSAKYFMIGDKTFDISSDTTIVDSGTSVLCLYPSTYDIVEEYLKNNVKDLVKKELYFTYSCGQTLPTIYFSLDSTEGTRYKYSLEEEYYSTKINGECAILIDSCTKNNILGDVFMRKYVSHFKYGFNSTHDAVGFALSVADPKDNFVGNSDGESHILFYILGGIGGAILILVGVLVYFYIKKRKARK